MKAKTIQHLNPIWRNEADFIIRVKLLTPSPDYDFAWEQLWTKKVSNNHFVICCIPFFAKDLSLGDEVETDAEFMITDVIKPSGHYTYRVWLGEMRDPNIRNDMLIEIEQKKWLLEWYSENLFAISCPEEIAQAVADFLYEKQKNGFLYYETGRTT